MSDQTKTTEAAPEAFDTEHRDFPICPHCGKVHTDMTDFELVEDNESEYDCDHCGKPMFITENVTRTYTTLKESQE